MKAFNFNTETLFSAKTLYCIHAYYNLSCHMICIYSINKCIIVQNLPIGFVSKNRIGALKIAVSILLCKFRAEAMQIRKESTDLVMTRETEPKTIPP